MISVIIPSYNAGRWLAESLDSILGQTVPPGEVVVVDDGSTDDSREVLAAYRGRVEVVSGEHGGLAAARNLGLRLARGDWIAFQDADDVALPDRLERLKAHLQGTPDADAVFADGAHLGNGGRIVPRPLAARAAGRRLGAADLFDGFPAYYQSALIARDALLSAGPFDPAYRIHPDHDHAFRLFGRAHVTYLDHPVFRYRRHEENITADALGAREELVHTLERVRRDDAGAVAAIGARRLDAALARHYFRIARTRSSRGETPAAGAAYDHAVTLAPLQLFYRWRRWRARRRG
jgi:glycosyltransferase involved in cell wall biosynthesis